jgi:hypothetical protein
MDDANQLPNGPPHRGKDSADVSAPMQQLDPIRPEVENPAPPIPATAAQLHETETKFEERMSAFERSMIRLTTYGLIVTCATALIFVGQLYEMISGGTQTDKLVDYASKQAKAANDMSQSADDFTDSTKWMEEHMQDAANAMQDSVDSADRNTKQTISNTQTAFRAEQRAWVGVQGVANSKGFTETEVWQITIVFFNSGRTPARNVQASGMYVTSRTPLLGPSTQQVAQLVFRPVQSIAPQRFYRENIGNPVDAEGVSVNETTGQKILTSQYTQIKNKQLFLYYYGLLKYEDNSGKPHESQFCVLLADPSTKEAGMCDSFNDLN